MQAKSGKKALGKQVVTDNGTELGELVDASFEQQTGNFKTLFVKPKSRPSRQLEELFDFNGTHFEIPAQKIKSIDHHVLVSG